MAARLEGAGRIARKLLNIEPQPPLTVSEGLLIIQRMVNRAFDEASREGRSWGNVDAQDLEDVLKRIDRAKEDPHPSAPTQIIIESTTLPASAADLAASLPPQRSNDWFEPAVPEKQRHRADPTAPRRRPR